MRVFTNFYRILFEAVLVLVAVVLLSAEAAAGVTSVTPNTWNIVGLDSNTPASGPSNFPVGAKVCSTNATETVNFVWDDGFNAYTGDPYINLRSGSNQSVTINTAGGCADAYFEVSVAKTSAAFDKTRRYHIAAGGESTPTPRELYVEHLVSQSRNGIDDIRYGTSPGSLTSVPAGGSMNLIVGNTYYIELDGHTAPGGYNQFEEFINFPNTIFQIQSVSTAYTQPAGNSNCPGYPCVYNPNDKLYADACGWENDPNSPYYLSCVGGDYKVGATVITTYTVKIIGGGGASETLGSLLYDFSGSSFHYNADYGTGARFANVIDPTNVFISKSFGPSPTNVGGVSTLTFTLTNPNAGVVSGMTFTDDLSTVVVVPSGGAMTVDASPNASTSGCGASAVFTAPSNTTFLSFSNGSIAGNSSCLIKVNVTTTATGTYSNTSGHLFVNSVDTTRTATASLMVDDSSFPAVSPPSSCASPVTLAAWDFNSLSLGSNSGPISSTTSTSDVSGASATYGAGTGSSSAICISTSCVFIKDPSGTIFPAVETPTNTNSWGIHGGWPGGGVVPTGTTTPYFQFAINASKYGGVSITSIANLQGNWTNGDSWYVLSSTDGVNWTQRGTAAWNNAYKGSNWGTINNNTSSPADAATTYYRIIVAGASLTKFDPSVFLDNVTITGCTRPDPPRITKSFSPNPVAVNGTSALTFTVTNPNSSAALGGIAFTDTLVSGLSVTSGSSTQCSGTLTRTAPNLISFASGTVALSSSCTITATVTATTAGPHQNVSGSVYSSQSGTNTGSNGFATASLTAVSPPNITKQFNQSSIISNGTATARLTFTIANPNQNDVLSRVTFTDNLPTVPGAMKVAAIPNAFTSGCVGSPTFAPGSLATVVSFSSGTIAAAGTCIANVDITLASIGTYTNASTAVTHIINGAVVSGNTATATITGTNPRPAIGLLKQVGPSNTGPWSSYLSLPTGSNVYYRFTIENEGDAPLDPVSVSDSILTAGPADPAGCGWTNPLPVASATQDPTETCVTGPVTAVSGSHANYAAAHGTSGTVYSSPTSTATYATTGLSVVKSVDKNFFIKFGDLLTYSYAVTNTGYATLSGPVTVHDDKVSVAPVSLTTIGNNDNYLQSGETVTFVASYSTITADVTAKLVTNTAWAETYSGGMVTGATTTTFSKTVGMEEVLVNKVVTVTWDPANGSGDGSTTFPHAIPGGAMQYAIGISNAATSPLSASLTTISDVLGDDVTLDPDLRTAGTATNYSSLAVGGGGAGYGFKVTCGPPCNRPTTYPAGSGYSKYFTAGATDTDGIDISGGALNTGTVNVDFTKVLPNSDGYAAGELKTGETVTIYFNVLIK